MIVGIQEKKRKKWSCGGGCLCMPRSYGEANSRHRFTSFLLGLGGIVFWPWSLPMPQTTRKTPWSLPMSQTTWGTLLPVAYPAHDIANYMGHMTHTHTHWSLPYTTNFTPCCLPRPRHCKLHGTYDTHTHTHWSYKPQTMWDIWHTHTHWSYKLQTTNYVGHAQLTQCNKLHGTIQVICV